MAGGGAHGRRGAIRRVFYLDVVGEFVHCAPIYCLMCTNAKGCPICFFLPSDIFPKKYEKAHCFVSNLGTLCDLETGVNKETLPYVVS